jgi:hypothetical protein
MRAVHAGERHVVAHQAATDFQRGEVPRDDDDAATGRARRLDVFQALDDEAAPSHRCDRAPPRAREFEQADAQRREVRAQQVLARARIQFGETQREVACGDAPALRHRVPQQAAERAAQPLLQPPGQARHRRHRPDAQPGGPVAWSQRRAFASGVLCHGGDSTDTMRHCRCMGRKDMQAANAMRGNITRSRKAWHR